MYCSLLVLLLTLPFYATAAELSVGYDSKYVSEGRDNLETGGILWTKGAFEVSDSFSFSAEYGFSQDSQVDYDEGVITLEYASSFDNINWYMGISRLAFFEDSNDDNELTLGFSKALFHGVIGFVDYIYSTQATGSFVELGIEKSWQLNDHTSLLSYALAGFDFGYVNERDNKYNHTAIGLALEYQISTQFLLSARLQIDFADSDMSQTVTRNTVGWAGLHLTRQF